MVSIVTVLLYWIFQTITLVVMVETLNYRSHFLYILKFKLEMVDKEMIKMFSFTF